MGAKSFPRREIYANLQSQSLLLFVGEQTVWNRATNTHLPLLFFCSLSPTNVLGVQHHLNQDVGKETVDFKSPHNRKLYLQSNAKRDGRKATRCLVGASGMCLSLSYGEIYFN